MRDDVREAIESACSGDDRGQSGSHGAKPRRRGISPEGLRHLLLNVLRDLPEDLSVRELREELE